MMTNLTTNNDNNNQSESVENSASGEFKLHPNVLEALKHPQRGSELRGWLKSHSEKALKWRGEFGETMMHWAFLSDWVFACDLKEVGLSFQEKDQDGRVPFDWLNDRLFGAVVNDKTATQLSKGGQERLRKQTEHQALSLWNMGARPSSPSLQNAFYGSIWMHAGCFSLLPLAQDEYGLSNWMPHKGSALHSSVLAPSTPDLWKWQKGFSEKHDINIEDEDGRTALWYCVDTWSKHENLRPSMEKIAKHLVQLGALGSFQDNHGYSPIMLLDFIRSTTDVSQIESILVPSSQVVQPQNDVEIDVQDDTQ